MQGKIEETIININYFLLVSFNLNLLNSRVELQIRPNHFK